MAKRSKEKLSFHLSYMQDMHMHIYALMITYTHSTGYKVHTCSNVQISAESVQSLRVS